MGKDTTAFRERFNAYKNGKSVSEIYDAGLPRYAGGTPFSDEEAMDYILQLENPSRVGYSKGIWRTPTDSTKYDIHQIGGGLDIREEHNPIVYNYLKNKGRLNDPWLTEAEEKLLRMLTWKGKKAIMDKFVAKHGDKLSLRGYDVAAGMLWHGHPFKMMNNADSITGKAFLNALASGDQDLSGVFDTYYGYGTNAKRFASRINANSKYWKNYKQILPVGVDKSDLVKQLENRPQFEYWQNYHQPDYPLNNPAPSSISSWNNSKSPAYTPAGLQTRRIDFGKMMMDMLEDDWEPPSIQPLKTVNSPDSKISTFTGFKNGKLPGYYIGTIPFIDEEKKLKQEEWSDQWQERLLPSARSKVIQKWNATGSKPEPESSEEYTKRRTKETLWKKPSGRKMLEMAPSVVDAVPIASDVKLALLTGAAALKGNYLEASLLGGGLLLPGLFKKAGKNSLKLLSNDELYKAAVERGDKQEALRLLEDAYLNSGINKTPIVVDNDGHAVGWFHGSEWGNHTIFDSNAMNATIGGSSASGKIKGNFLTTDLPSAKRYAGSSRYSTTEDPRTTTPNTFVEKLLNLFGTYQPRFLYPAERVGDYAPKPERLFDTHGLAPINHLDKTDNVVYPMYVNPGENPMVLDFNGKPWSQSPVLFPNNFYLKRYIRDDEAKTYRDVIIPFKDKKTAMEAWMSDPINVYRDVTNLDDKYFDEGIRSIYAHNSAPRYEKVGLIEERVPNTTNGAVQTAAKEGNSSVLMKNVIDSNGGPDGLHYAIDDLATLKSELMKLADITYDDAGNLIPLSKRFDWTNPDIRYILTPFLIGGAGYGAYNKLSSYKNGKSPIYIKPANRGKFTALKKRTGHSASWFKENGTPEQKKMAIFALNARKWKH